MPKYAYTIENKTAIKNIVSEGRGNTSLKIWEHDVLKKTRADIKTHIINERENGKKCAYCLKSFNNEHNMNIDIEHILPKSKYPKYTFTLKNLAVACKRCNLQIKRDDTSFLTTSFNPRKPFKSEFYKLTHPVIDKKNKLQLREIRFQNIHIVKYTYDNEKAKYTYDYFKLENVEIEQLDHAQGIIPLIDYLSTLK
ncbi:HNH endonuclease [Aeromonas enteropelogenes]|uniref:HNH endonuclease n=1 Tax=Aeromonas enteropelogenes TaxID=29489 RepID=UPI003BA23FD5